MQDGAAEAAALGVVINGVTVSDGELVQRVAGTVGLWVDLQRLAEWRLKPAAGATRAFDGRTHGLICHSPEAMRCLRDDDTALLTIEAAPASFTPLRLAAPSATAAEVDDDAPVGGYLNYDLYGSRAGHASLVSGVADLRLFAGTSHGFVRGGFVAGSGVGATAGPQRWSRVAAAWQWDEPERIRSLTLGNFISEAPGPQAPLPALGLRYATNPALRPELNWSAKPVIVGEVLRPSRAELFVDGLFHRGAEVPYGRFEIESDALLPGASDLELALTDLRGDRQWLTQRAYYAPQLLAAGRSSFAFEAGLAGRQFALRTEDTTPFASWQQRHGASDRLTVISQLAAAREERLASLGADRLIGRYGVSRGAVSVFDRGYGPRLRGMLGHEFQSRRFSGLVRVEAAPADRECRQCADARAPVTTGTATTLLPLRPSLLPHDRGQFTLATQAALGGPWQLGAAFFARELLDGRRQRSVSSSLSWRDGRGTQLSAGLQRFDGVLRGQQFFIGLLVPLDRRWLASSTATHSRVGGKDQSSLQWSVQSLRRDPNADDEAQITVFGTAGPRSRAGANLVRDEQFGQWGLEVQGDAKQARAAGRLGGGLGWTAGHFFATRRIDDGFIVVDADGQADVPVFVENRYAGKTGIDGRLLVPGARAFQTNRISIDAAALPIDFTLSEDQLDVVPRSRGGAVARFEIGDGGELVRVRRADGSLPPAGAQALISTQRKPAVVNSRGEVFVQRATRPSRVELSWPGGGCSFDFMPVGADTQRPGDGFACL